MNPRYPVYIISKGRWEKRLTIDALEAMDVPFRLVIEPQEYELYANHVDSDVILTLPFSNLGQGSIPARNWVWEHSIKAGAERHWIIDDNIDHFGRFNRNKRIRVNSGTIFRAAEDFVDRYVNVALAGFQYRGFTEERIKHPPFILNTRIYSCILIKNDIPFRWRGRYNEDTDLSLRVLKEGWCTILFYAFFADKVKTMSMHGGNTDELYQGDGRLKMARSLKNQHPDVVKIKKRWDRWQHVVDYRPFKKNKLILKKDVNIAAEVNNYGMELGVIKDGKQ